MKKDFFLESKIQTPGVSRSFLAREALLEKLDAAEERLLIVSAGMGYGKTVLLTHYARRHPEQCAWYHLSETDNDIMVFARYLRESIRRTVPEFKLDLAPYLALEQSSGLALSLALEFSAALKELGSRRLDLILDDFQTVEDECVFQFLQLLLDNAPESMRLILCTKSAPPQFCARYLMEQRAMMLGSDDLAFNLDEVRQLIAEDTPPERLDTTASALREHIEGWPAGISFAILFFRQRRGPIEEEHLKEAYRQSYLWDYFMHELFRKLPYELQQFLVSTSVLDFLQPELCNYIADVDNAASQLSYLVQENLFILRLSGGENIYRYHSLFREFLQSQLQSAQREQLCQKASDFFYRTPDKSRAVEFAIACRDGERIRIAVEAAGREALMQGRMDTVKRWLDVLEEIGGEPSPEILLLSGEYQERAGCWREALALEDRIEALGRENLEERIYMEARLLRARVIREHSSPEQSLAILREIQPRVRRSSAMVALRRQGLELMVHNLLDLREPGKALELVLNRLEEAASRRNLEEQTWMRELAVLCYCALGEYRHAMQLYVVLRSSGGGASVSHYIHLYLAASGRPEQALNRLSRAVEEASEWSVSWFLKNLLLAQMLVEQIAVLEGISFNRDSPVRRFLAGVDLTRGQGAGFGSLFTMLCRAMLEELTEQEEDELFAVDSGRSLTIQDGVRWLTVRRRVLRGDRERALELCRRSGPERAEQKRINAFFAFLTVEEALLLREKDPARAVELIGRITPYLRENRLVCPGLTAGEKAALEHMSGLKEGILRAEDSDQEPLTQGKLTVRSFGPFRVFLPDGQEISWRTRKAMELFAYLFHARGEYVNRERLMDLLWPQAPLTNATSLLHTTLYSIRKMLAPYGLERVLLREKKGYRMDLSLVDSDREQLERILNGKDSGEQGGLIDLYRGSYLEDVEAEWAEGARAWYAGAFLQSCRKAAEECRARGDCQMAAECLRQALAQDPYDEELTGQLISCYGEMGQIHSAMQLYNRLKETLEQDLNTEPGEAVTRCYRECLLRRLDSGRRAR